MHCGERFACRRSLEGIDLSQSLAAFVSDFADQAVVLPAAVLIGFALLLAGWARGAVVWVSVIAATFAAVLILKLVFEACGARWGSSIESPSGHTAAAAVFYGGVLSELFGRRARLPWSAALAVAVVVGLVGFSRLVLGAHTPAEAALGGAVGLLGLSAMLVLAGPSPVSSRRLAAFALPALAVVVVLHGIRLPAEIVIRGAAINIWPLSACRQAQSAATTADSAGHEAS
jgi:membrane-associated phospholipid phosphatase